MALNDDTKLLSEPNPNDPLLSTVPAPRVPVVNPYAHQYSGGERTGSGFNVREYWRVVRKNIWAIITLVTVTTTIVAVASYRVGDRYKGSTLIQIEDPAESVAGSKDGLIVVTDTDKYYKTQLRLLQMPELTRRVVVELDLIHNPNFFSSKPTSLKDAIFSLMRPQRSGQARGRSTNAVDTPIDLSKPLDTETIRLLQPYVSVVASGLSVEEVAGTQLLWIAFEHSDPEIAAKVSASLAENFIRENFNRRVAAKSSTSDFLRKRLGELEFQIRSGEERLLNYARTHELVSDDVGDEDNKAFSQNPSLTRLTGLNEKYNDALTELQALEASREALKEAGVTDIMKWPIAQQDPGAVEVSKNLNSLKQKRAELSVRYTDEHPQIRSIDAQIADQMAEMEKVKTRLAQQAETDYKAAVGRVDKMRGEIDVQKGSIMQQNEDRIGYRILQQEIDTNKRFHASLTTRLKETEISAANEINNIVLKERAIGANRTGPDRSNWILLSFLISLGGGFGLAIIREFLDQTIKSIDDVDRVAKLPSLGIIPALGAGPGNKRKLLGTGSSPGDLSDELITSVQVQSSAAEAYRHLRTSILLSSAGHPSKLLLVTSSQPREGKTTTAVNTAISLAQTGASVVIVDCDMRKPRVHKLLNVDDEMGVSLYLSGQNENLDELIQPHQIPNLSVLGCGPIPPNPAELLGSTQMRKLLASLLQQFDHVVIDSPPVISFADPVILSTMVDGVILVVRGGFTSRGIMLRSRQILSDVGAKIYGVVLNDADMRSNEAYYYKYSTYYYYNDGKRRGRKQREPVADTEEIED